MLRIDKGNLIGQRSLTFQGFMNQRQLIFEVPFYYIRFYPITHFKEKQFHSQQSVKNFFIYLVLLLK
ncbi:hypothetical protein BCR24_10545 [Enterococcus ureilyticus]|uniref:Uncharacterized protein n=1 Tax=Enterococcus ureilyticus TaxID=1131292 RepID=A0A1E5HFL1_9ENTE|nr:hypothetical protein [Enterococcus ureilyticus]MBM7689403.1 hypothetical protein [Enterococcus ureilyticus]MBO0444845.1 hypothetical protein [Enterococcus ureilyticus]OEG23742.1 hypothetical protein BCR24_10545 [Enterococcus ureilyticus]